MLDKETVKRILHLHKVQGLKAGAIAERFGFSSSRIHSVIRRQASSSQAPSSQASSSQASSALKKPQLNDIKKLERNNAKKRS